MSTASNSDDHIRTLVRRAVAATPPSPTFDEALRRAADLGATSDEPYLTAATTQPRRHRLRTFLATVVAALTVGGGGYLAYANLVGPDGYDSPTAAAQGFVDALSSGNLLRASRALAPFEREHMDVRLRNVLKLVVEDGALRANDVEQAKHISLSQDGLTWHERAIAPGYTRVEATAGHLWLKYDSSLFGAGLDGASGGRVDLVDLLRPPDDDRVHPASFVTVQRDGAWYVSLSYSIIDAVVGSRRAQVDLRSPVTSTGSATPEAAATNAFIALYGGGDGASPALIDQLDPVSGEAFFRYRRAIAPDPRDATAPPRAPRWRIEGSGQWRIAQLVAVELPNTTDGVTTYSSVTEQGCREAAQKEYDDPSTELGPWDCRTLRNTSAALVERGGRWYVDPIESVGRLVLPNIVGVRSARSEVAETSSGAGDIGQGGAVPTTTPVDAPGTTSQSRN